jgi:beta-mannanase
MKSATFRIISTTLAIIISSLIVYALSHAGKSSKGPIENVMSYTGEAVQNIEKKLIVEAREEKREDKLQWLKPYFDSKKLLLHPPKILLGAFDNETNDSYEPIVALEDSLKMTFPLIHIYTAWGSKPEEKFPTDRVKNIITLGSIPVITWEPWLSDFNEETYPEGQKPVDADKNGMKAVASGVYDNYINQWAAAARKINSHLFLRLGHEMNDGYRYPWGPHNNTPQEFNAAWQHVHDLFVKQGAKNVIWVWSPHPAYEYREFYPGDAYVDYVGVGVLNYGTVAPWSKWWTFKDIFGKFYDSVAVYKKPIMITEFGSLAVGGNRAKWYADALDNMPQRYPNVKSVVFFHRSKDNTTTQQVLNWYIKNDHPVTTAIVKEVGKWKQ